MGSNAQGLYLLAWDMLQHHLEYFRYRPREFIMAAARYTRSACTWNTRAWPRPCKPTASTRPLGRLMVGLMWPLGYALYRRDRRRGIA